MSTVSPDAARSALRAHWEHASRICDSYPELSLRVYAAPDGMHLSAFLWLPGPHVGRPYLPLREAVWQPSEVTEVAVVDWGRRALASWLEEQLVDL